MSRKEDIERDLEEQSLMEGLDNIRLDDLPVQWYRPLNHYELSEMGPIRIGPGKTEIRKTILGRLMAERDRLLMVAEVSRWTLEELKEVGIIDNKWLMFEEEDEQTPTTLGKAIHLLIETLEYCDGINEPTPQTRPCKLGERNDPK